MYISDRTYKRLLLLYCIDTSFANLIKKCQRKKKLVSFLLTRVFGEHPKEKQNP